MATWNAITDVAKERHIKTLIFRLWGIPPKAASPCPLPVSMSPSDLPTLKRAPYLVAPKHDGTRYLLLLTQYPAGVNVAVLVSRNWKCYPITVVARGSYFKAGSLFDGELIREPITHANCTEGWRFMYRVFDVVAVAGQSHVQCDYTRRHAVLRTLFFERDNVDTEALYDPRAWHNVTAPTIARQSGKLVACGNAHYLGFRCKTWRPLTDIQAALRDMRAGVSDGLIFMPVAEGVWRTTKHTRMFKWKTRHTIDLRVSVGEAVHLVHYDTATRREVEGCVDGYELRCIGEVKRDLAGVTGVCEFQIMHVADGVVYLQFVCTRPDKSNANTSTVIAATIDNHVNPVTQDMLVDTCTK